MSYLGNSVYISFSCAVTGGWTGLLLISVSEAADSWRASSRPRPEPASNPLPVQFYCHRFGCVSAKGRCRQKKREKMEKIIRNC